MVAKADNASSKEDEGARNGGEREPKVRKRRRTKSPPTEFSDAAMQTIDAMDALLRKESDTYRKISDAEKKLELILMRKLRETRDMIQDNVLPASRIFRLYVQWKLDDDDTRSEQNASASSETEDGHNSSWTFRLFGELLPSETPGDPIDEEPSFSHMFKEIKAKLVARIPVHEVSDSVTWNATKEVRPADGAEFTLSLRSLENVQLLLNLQLNDSPHRVILSETLSKIVGVDRETRSGVLMSVWQHIKVNNLQAGEEAGFIVMDDYLRALIPEQFVQRNPHIMTVERMRLSLLVDLLEGHLEREEFRLVLSVDSGPGRGWAHKCFDLSLEMEDVKTMPAARARALMGPTTEYTNKFQALQLKTNQTLDLLGKRYRRKSFFSEFYNNPRQFIDHFFLSQTRDLAQISGGTGRMPEEDRHSSFYQARWVREIIPAYLQGKKSKPPPP